MPIQPVGSAAPVVARTAPVVLPPPLIPSADRTAYFVLRGASGLVIQSYGAIAVISPAALALSGADAVRADGPPPRPAPVVSVARIAAAHRIDVRA